MKDVQKYIATIENYSEITPMDRKILQVGDTLRQVIIFHDASVSTIGVIIYLLIEDKDKVNHLRITKVGTKNQSHSIPVLEHVSRTYALVLLRPLLSVIKQVVLTLISSFLVTAHAPSNY